MKKISLIGAGNIGTILAYNLSRKQIGPITMVDVVEGLAKGKCLDLSQSLPIENLNVKIEGTTDISAIKDSEVIIITAGIARKPGMSRDDLIETNFSIMNEIGKAIKKFSPSSFVICVTNPLDAMVWSLREISGIKSNMIRVRQKYIYKSSLLSRTIVKGVFEVMKSTKWTCIMPKLNLCIYFHIFNF